MSLWTYFFLKAAQSILLIMFILKGYPQLLHKMLVDVAKSWVLWTMPMEIVTVLLAQEARYWDGTFFSSPK